ncbi:MAG: hydrogenase maturation nickel metallochaperone HypA [Candidatus Cloacimonadota bacterium]|nr:hydrogenase maturation nickel metallochaperone HypA [Candidatus Cloacimonadota bacterium]
MHESSIVLSILESTSKIRDEENLEKIDTIKIVVGKMHQIIPKFMYDLFAEMKMGFSGFENTQLQLTEIDVYILCPDCGQKTNIAAEPIFICPKCNSLNTELVSGDEFYIESIVGEK